MNTRVKIIDAEELSAILHNSSAILVVGVFDPLLAAHAERLAEIARPGASKLVVAVTDPLSAALLPVRARMEMAAAVGVVDFVLSYESGIETRFPWADIYDDTAQHEQWSVDFIQHVRRRSKAISA
ncbi:MAG TPA: hypothetical protein VGL53_16655 [Bryobacteraceae bacterium]|jgi:glycerol-3-phosphate cytidylyltransferase-like family protein